LNDHTVIIIIVWAS